MRRQQEEWSWLTKLQALVMAGVVASIIFTGWQVVVKYVGDSEYSAPHQPYVSVGKGFNRTTVGSLSHTLEQQVLAFWRYGA